MTDDTDAWFDQQVDGLIESEREQWDPDDLPESQQRLLADLKAADAPDWMLQKVRVGVYHDYASPAALPKHVLMCDAKTNDLPTIVEGITDGRYDP